jgi:hypothetical protein
VKETPLTIPQRLTLRQSEKVSGASYVRNPGRYGPQFGETECIALSDRDYTGEIDDDVLNGGLERASATIDSYLLAVIRCRGPIRPGS